MMNKEIKIIELLNKIANGEYPKKFKYKNRIYEYKRIIQGTGYVTEKNNWFNFDIDIDDWNTLNAYVEILEDNTEEIEELEIYNNVVTDERIKINELVREVNKMRKEKN